MIQFKLSELAILQKANFKIFSDLRFKDGRTYTPDRVDAYVIELTLVCVSDYFLSWGGGFSNYNSFCDFLQTQPQT
jgi:hypothetical protein